MWGRILNEVIRTVTGLSLENLMGVLIRIFIGLSERFMGLSELLMRLSELNGVIRILNGIIRSAY